MRETGLTHMRPGQEATIDVDAYPYRTFKAHVVSMSPGTGSDFAVLPPRECDRQLGQGRPAPAGTPRAR
jgi:multidrug resistance efflux pump